MIEMDKSIEKYVKNYKKQIAAQQDEELKDKLLIVLESALQVSETRDGFFELLSYGNYLVAAYRDLTESKEAYREVLTEKLREEAEKIKTRRETREEVLPKTVDPFAETVKGMTYEKLHEEIDALPVLEKKVVTSLYFGDGTEVSLTEEIGKGREFVISLRQSAREKIASNLPLEYLYTENGARLKTLEEIGRSLKKCLGKMESK